MQALHPVCILRKQMIDQDIKTPPNVIFDGVYSALFGRIDRTLI